MQKIIIILGLLLSNHVFAENIDTFPDTFYPAELINGDYFGDDDCDFNCATNLFRTYYLSINNRHVKLVITSYQARNIGEGIYAATQQHPVTTVIEANCLPISAIMLPDTLSDLIAMECIDHGNKTIIEWHMKNKELKDKYPITLTVKTHQTFSDIRMQKTRF